MAYGIPDAKRAPASLVFDGTTTDFQRDQTTGRFKSRHWVDAAVWFHLRTRRGSVRSAPTLGNDVRNIRYIDKLTTAATVQDRVLSAVAGLISDNLIRVVSIDVDLSTPGAILYQFTYQNLITGKVQPPISLPAV